MRDKKMSRWPTVPQDHWELASAMRREPTRAEQTLWKSLRGKQLGVSFRRQHPIGPYIVDFVCLDLHLVIEVDGDVHEEPEQIRYDNAREEYLERRGFQIRRYSNGQVLNSLYSVLEDIQAVVNVEVRTREGET